MKTIPTFDLERECGGIVAGVDEAGRGPLCGPVVAAAVVFPAPACGGGIDFVSEQRELTKSWVGAHPLIADSKQLTAKQREAAFEWIIANCAVGVGQCSPAEIDEINILQASLLAMKRAIAALPRAPDFCLIDGNKMPADIVGRAVVKGDAKSVSIAAASIVAKVSRDKIMAELARDFPEYGWDKNAGYPTPAHYSAIAAHGITKHHRKTFRLV
ncbi:MAG: ribonuclease HII [Rickettsiales bacterium]|jgi:ribonuclease HII|nr:ribonuclease HII [Rickettsiales bacterium]